MKIVAGGVYYDKDINENILITEVLDNIVHFEWENGDMDWYEFNKKDMDIFVNSLTPVNDIAIVGARNLSVRVKRLSEHAILPEYKSLGAAGFDLHITEDITIPANSVRFVTPPSSDGFVPKGGTFKLTNDNHGVVGTGLAFEIPMGYELEIRGRSGIAFKHQVMAYNGTIDSDYRSEVKLLISNFGDEDITFKKGDRVAQGVIKKVDQVSFLDAEHLSETERGSGGFGSTGLS